MKAHCLSYLLLSALLSVSVHLYADDQQVQKPEGKVAQSLERSESEVKAIEGNLNRRSVLELKNDTIREGGVSDSVQKEDTRIISKKNVGSDKVEMEVREGEVIDSAPDRADSPQKVDGLEETGRNYDMETTEGKVTSESHRSFTSQKQDDDP